MKNHKYYQIAIVIAISVLMSNCVHYYYAPNAHNVPMLEEKGHTKINVALSGGDEFGGFEAQFATAVSSHMGVMANFITASGSDESESGSGTLFEVGAGYFSPVGERFIFENYGGIGFGGVSNSYDSGSSKLNFTRYFLQPGIGFITNGFDIVLSVRMAGLQYSSFDHHALESYDLDDIDYIRDHDFSILFEPALTIRGGWENIKVQLQYVASNNLNNKELQQEVGNINIGLVFNIYKK